MRKFLLSEVKQLAKKWQRVAVEVAELPFSVGHLVSRGDYYLLLLHIK